MRSKDVTSVSIPWVASHVIRGTKRAPVMMTVTADDGVIGGDVESDGSGLRCALLTGDKCSAARARTNKNRKSIYVAPPSIRFDPMNRPIKQIVMMTRRTYLLGSGLLDGGGLLLNLGLGGELDLARGALGENEGLLLSTAGDGLVDAGVEASLGALGSLGMVRLDVLLDGGTADTGAGLGGVSKDGLLDHGLVSRRDGVSKCTQHTRRQAHEQQMSGGDVGQWSAIRLVIVGSASESAARATRYFIFRTEPPQTRASPSIHPDKACPADCKDERRHIHGWAYTLARHMADTSDATYEPSSVGDLPRTRRWNQRPSWRRPSWRRA